MCVLEACAMKHKEARTERSCKERVYFQCTKPGCYFCCHVNRAGDGLFRVTKWIWHTCGPFDKPLVKRDWVAHKAKEMLPEREWLRGKELKKVLCKEHGLEAKVSAAMKAVAKAKKLQEDEEGSFDKLPGLFETLKRQNQGTVAEIAME